MVSTKTPLRITLGGGGSDLPDYYSKYKGFVFAVTINKFISILVKENQSGCRVDVQHLKTEVVNHRDQLKHDIIREAMRLTGIENNVTIETKSDILPGTGLGSSGSFTVGLLNALHVHRGEFLSPMELSEEACHLEMNILNHYSGKQDQYMAAFGGLLILEIERNGHVDIKKARISVETARKLNQNLQLFYTKLQRDANLILSNQCLGIKRNSGETIHSMHRIKEIGYGILEAVETGNLLDFGLLMDEHWRFKKKVSSKMSNPYLDHVYHTAKKNGAIGGKIVGAGGGGFFLFYSEKNDGKLNEEMEKLGLKKMNYRFESRGTLVLEKPADSGMLTEGCVG
jgi:D-glycero-alpha-D-manno-heptose-7-phosphate kinase